MKLTRVLVPSVRASPAAGKVAERLGFSPALRASFALRMRPMHAVPEQLSPVVVALPSSHARALARCSQPTGAGELTSVVQRLPSSQVGAVPQTFATPAPQVCGAVQAPQVSAPPQPSATVPQPFPCAAQVVGVQAGVVTVPCHRVWCCTPPTVQVTWRLTALPAGTVPAARNWTAVARTSGAAWAANGVTVAVPEMAPTLTSTPVQPAG